MITFLFKKNVYYFDRFEFQAFSGTLMVFQVNDEKGVCLRMPLS